MLSLLRRLLSRDVEVQSASDAPEANSPELPPTPENLATQERLNAIVRDLSERFKVIRVGQRDEIHAKALSALCRLDEADSFERDNPGFQISNLADARTIALQVRDASVPLHTRQDETSTLVCVIDTETTGVSDQDEPISVAAVLVEMSCKYGDVLREVDSYVGLREPSIGINPRAYQVHGLSMEDVRGRRFDMARLYKIIDSADVLVAHNASFDCRMMECVMPSISQKRWGCSMNGLRWAWSDMAGGQRGLDAICRALEIPKAERHDAMGDVRALLQVLATKTGVTAKSQTLLSRLIRKATKDE